METFPLSPSTSSCKKLMNSEMMDDLHEESNEFSEMFQIELQIFNKSFFLSIFTIWFINFVFILYFIPALYKLTGDPWMTAISPFWWKPGRGGGFFFAPPSLKILQARSGFAKNLCRITWERKHPREFFRFYDVMMTSLIYVRLCQASLWFVLSSCLVEKFNNLNKGALLTVAFE